MGMTKTQYLKLYFQSNFPEFFHLKASHRLQEQEIKIKVINWLIDSNYCLFGDEDSGGINWNKPKNCNDPILLSKDIKKRKHGTSSFFSLNTL